MKQWLIKRIKKAFENIESTIMSIFVLALLGGSIGIFSFSKRALNFSLQILNTPTPLWAATALVLTTIVYTYLKTRSLQPPKAKPKKIEWFTYCEMKWEVIIYEDKFEIDKIPFCIEHDQQFINEYKGYGCPGTESQICKSMLPYELHDEYYSAVMSMVESQIRNGKKLR